MTAFLTLYWTTVYWRSSAITFALQERSLRRCSCSPISDPTYCLLTLEHLLRWSMKDSLMSHWEAEAAQVADEYGEKFDVVQPQKEKVERLLDPS